MSGLQHYRNQVCILGVAAKLLREERKHDLYCDNKQNMYVYMCVHVCVCVFVYTVTLPHHI